MMAYQLNASTRLGCDRGSAVGARFKATDDIADERAALLVGVLMALNDMSSYFDAFEIGVNSLGALCRVFWGARAL